jgi:cytochrome bd-type quinol oxidase subunit 2
MKKKIFFTIISALILAFSLLLAYLLNKSHSISGDENITLYWIIKGVVVVNFVVVVIYLLLKKQEVSSFINVYAATLVIQLLPLLVRALLRGDSPKYVLAIIISFVIHILYFAFIFGFSILNDKTNAADLKLVGKSIQVLEEESFNDSDGNFKSAGKRKDL